MHWTYAIISGVLTSMFLVWFLIDLFYANTPDHPGTVEIADIVNLGFGPDKKLIVIDYDVSKIDMTDKQWANMEVYYTLPNGSVETFYTPIGIEIKGSGLSERPKLNYGLEIWEPDAPPIPCTSIDTCDDGKANLFDIFTDDFEDWVMRGGYKEPTLLRDTIPSQMKGGIMEHTLVELVFRNNGKYYYEGVYILYPAIQRKLLEKKLNWPIKGKKEDCEDNPTPTDIQETALIGEYTNPGPGSRKTTCEGIDMVKMRYPKCDDIVPCYQTHVKSYFDMLTMTNTSVVDVNLNSFALNFLAESMMLNGDFPIASQYFYKSPHDGVFHAGPRWDYDYLSWRFAKTDTWDVSANYGSTHMPFWVHLGTNTEFIDLVNSFRVLVTTTNYNAAKATIDERRDQFEAGYFDRNIERWGGYGNRPVPYTKDFNLAVSGVRKDWKAEIDFIEEIFDKRAAWMLSNPAVPFEFNHDNFFIVRNLFMIIPFLFFFMGFLVTIVLIILTATEVIPHEEETVDEIDEEEGKPLVLEAIDGSAGWRMARWVGTAVVGTWSQTANKSIEMNPLKF